MSLRDSDAFSLRIGWERLGESPADFSVPRWARWSPAKSSPKICATRWDGRKARGEGWATYLTASLPLRRPPWPVALVLPISPRARRLAAPPSGTRPAMTARCGLPCESVRLGNLVWIPRYPLGSARVFDGTRRLRGACDGTHDSPFSLRVLISPVDRLAFSFMAPASSEREGEKRGESPARSHTAKRMIFRPSNRQPGKGYQMRTHLFIRVYLSTDGLRGCLLRHA